ncbi:CRISPR-associated ring nuclease Csm6 [Methylovulum psychrotolerans]|uniref:CRISPR-associated protein n=1 Tax=Methylovulum psychrotolerans TaxID=1704499 RepID=A0A1Z4BYQ5_9GAMM|nr:CRISPR-associated ring nuclease Csm6 [Methylovulum psychrotolerans]ASF46391.1 CRISPR-associated protein [Methylovulum psychrotolerans]
MKAPWQFDKRVLLAVSGMSPQILTETLYALAVDSGQPAFVPTEVHLITTIEGAERAKLQLLHSKTGKFGQFCHDYHLNAIQFTEQNLHVITDANGTPLADIATPQQNEAAADFITQIVADLTRDANSALHVSIAGGRKTMGYYLGYALSLYGRPQDRLSHVLVTDRFEGLHDFFYPTPESRVIYDKTNKPLDTQQAKVLLAEIPFVRLRSGIPTHLLSGKVGFNESIHYARQLEAPPKLEVNFTGRHLSANGITVKLTYINFAFYVWMIQQTIDNGDWIERQVDPSKVYAASFIKVYQTYHPTPYLEGDKTIDILSKEGMDKNWLSERISQVKKSFKEALGETPAQAYIVQALGGNNKKYYSLALQPEQIHYL